MHLYENLKGKSVMPLPSDQEFEKRWMTVELICYVKTIIFYAYIYIYIYIYYDFFCRRHSFMNQPCYNNLF